MVDRSLRARGGLFCSFLHRFFTTERTHLVRRSDTDGRFLSPSSLQCRCSQRLRTHAPFVGAFADRHIPHTTVHIPGYRHISACSCTLPRLLPVPTNILVSYNHNRE
jgi:hypothetical protein